MATSVSSLSRGGNPRDRAASSGQRPLSRLAAVRLQKELTEWQTDAPEGLWLNPVEDLTSWDIGMAGPENSLYSGEIFTLRFKFSNEYPMDSPEVIFVGNPPIHPHIYSNGHICLNILYSGWSPAMTVVSTSLSLASMLASNTVKERPEGDEDYCRRSQGRSPKKGNWIFDDDKV